MYSGEGSLSRTSSCNGSTCSCVTAPGMTPSNIEPIPSTATSQDIFLSEADMVTPPYHDVQYII